MRLHRIKNKDPLNIYMGSYFTPFTISILQENQTIMSYMKLKYDADYVFKIYSISYFNPPDFYKRFNIAHALSTNVSISSKQIYFHSFSSFEKFINNCVEYKESTYLLCRSYKDDTGRYVKGLRVNHGVLLNDD